VKFLSAARKLFIPTSPTVMDGYETRLTSVRRRLSEETVRQMDLFRRGLQAIPPRELRMIFKHHVHEAGQEDVASLFDVRQSNISYRMKASQARIKLFVELKSIVSESAFRSALFRAGCDLRTVELVLGVSKTCSQRAVADAMGINQGTVRAAVATAVRKIRELAQSGDTDAAKSVELLGVVTKNYNKLRAIRPQKRWSAKVGQSLYAEE
jgi:DNA-directed RNA polymerase specialized sigma24 family protein